MTRGIKDERYPAGRNGWPAMARLGPCPCHGCGTPVIYAHGVTRDGWNGPQIPGLLKWRERTGAVHECGGRAKKRLGYTEAKNRPGAKAA